MPFQDSGKAPKQPHLGVMVQGGECLALPPGAQMLIVEDPTDDHQITPVILVKVSLRQIVFRCACHKPNCTRVLKYQLRAEGIHPRKQ